MTVNKREVSIKPSKKRNPATGELVRSRSHPKIVGEKEETTKPNEKTIL